uniref:Uncharacterized protein n=1 Tax=Cacopsylla melanoneura TaxID=428564 RepID=A0A8D8YKH7_9HEMI
MPLPATRRRRSQPRTATEVTRLMPVTKAQVRTLARKMRRSDTGSIFLSHPCEVKIPIRPRTIYYLRLVNCVPRDSGHQCCHLTWFCLHLSLLSKIGKLCPT